ncbi:MAG: peptidylprolyl isomerase [Pseudomonadota bacterium]
MIFFRQLQLGSAIFHGLTAPFVGFILLSTVVLAQTEDAIVAKVNGRLITEADVRLAEAEIGQDLLRHSPATRRRVVIEFLIQNELFADAAEKKNVAVSSVFKERQHYWDRRNMRDDFFDQQIKSQITEVEARRYYDQRINNTQGGQQIRASQILLTTQDEAKAVFELIVHDGDFSDLARQHSVDAHSAAKGGDLGYFGRGHLAPALDKAVFSLNVGEVSEPVQTDSGWHLVKVTGKRAVETPTFQDAKEGIISQLIHERARAMVEVLRSAATIEYLDPVMKQQ